MQTAYHTFKLILGLIASAFILYFLISYSGQYSTVQTSLQKNIVVRNFIDLAKNVYLTGISANHTDFARAKVDVLFSAPGGQPIISFSGGNMNVGFPLLLRPGRELYIHRNGLDFGWWKFYFVEALPDMDIIFNPLDTDSESWSLIKSIVWIFPSTLDSKVKIGFGFCDGIQIAGPYDRYDFLNNIYSFSMQDFNECKLALGNKTILVSVSAQCSENITNSSDVCIRRPLNGIGYAFAGNNTYLYKDVADLAAIIIGAGDGFLSNDLYTLKNSFFRKELSTAARVMQQRAILISQSTAKAQCVQMFSEFRNVLGEIENILATPDYYKDERSVTVLSDALSRSKDKYDQLVLEGCE